MTIHNVNPTPSQQAALDKLGADMRRWYDLVLRHRERRGRRIHVMYGPPVPEIGDLTALAIYTHTDPRSFFIGPRGGIREVKIDA